MLRVAFDDRVSGTLETIRSLRAPVLRSCHVGNNGSYNFGWLALAANTRFCMYDHTTYGADRVCHPWMIVGDRGRIRHAFSLDGSPRSDLQGLHVSAPQAVVPVKHRSVLNFGVRAHLDGVPLVTRHYLRNRQLAESINGKAPTFDSELLRDHFDVLLRLVEALADQQRLDLLFDRWVASKNGKAIVLRLAGIQCRGHNVSMVAADGTVLFDGDLAGLLDKLRVGLERVVRRVGFGEPQHEFDYPWLRLEAAYLFGAVCESVADPSQRRFYHAGGLTSPYYMNTPAFQQSFAHVGDAIKEAGLLPSDAEFVVIPIGACQFFSRPHAAPLLDELLECAIGALRSISSPATVSAGLREMAASDTSWTLPLLGGVHARARDRLRQLVREFNKTDPNGLPSCLRTNDLTRFTRYGADGIGEGVASSEEPLHFPPALTAMTWGEAEWIVQALGEMCADVPEDIEAHLA